MKHLEIMQAEFAKQDEATEVAEGSEFTLNAEDQKAFDKAGGKVIVAENEEDEGMTGRLLKALKEDTFIVETDEGVKMTVKGTIGGVFDGYAIIIGTYRTLED